MTLTRVALVTGAGSGIGRGGVALSLAARQYHLVCAGRRLDQVEATVESVHQEGGSAGAVALDVSRADQVAEQEPIDGSRGHLVSINSGAEVHGYANGSAYSASKHALRGLVESQMSAGRNVARLPASSVGDLVAFLVSVPGATTIDRVDVGQLQL